ncbi:hypothetical protein TELCIR_20012 [Teladorsagia circumcincta]|uniref:Uncharacterized protein n=1 Tax=Teladorsagia circumcincta TaxID=45464 RepID=A0A2G9TKP4_TELCI|nr:hypothetical protein TELCIR_20012 [Teladorsagia circumcincta]
MSTKLLQLRDLGIQIIYSLIGNKPDQDNADKFTGDPKFCIDFSFATHFLASVIVTATPFIQHSNCGGKF